MVKEINSRFSPSSYPIYKPEENNSKVNWNRNKIKIVGITIGAIPLSILIIITEIATLIREMQIWRSNLSELQEKISLKVSNDFIEKVKTVSKQVFLNEVFLLNRLLLIQNEERAVFSYLEEKFELSTENLREILMGAHVRLDDNGQAYEAWSKFVNKHFRISSHPSDQTQYSIRGPLFKECIFSRITEENGKVYTWFQLENHPVKLGHIIRHMVDYIKYKITKKNQGPYGSCEITDRAPLILSLKCG